MFNPEDYNEAQLNSIYTINNLKNEYLKKQSRIVDINAQIFKLNYRVTEYKVLENKIQEKVIKEELDKDERLKLTEDENWFLEFLFLSGNSYYEAERELLNNLSCEAISLTFENVALNNKINKLYSNFED